MNAFDILAPILSAALAGVLCFRAGQKHEAEEEAKRRFARRESLKDRTITSGSLDNKGHSRVSTARIRRVRR